MAGRRRRGDLRSPWAARVQARRDHPADKFVWEVQFLHHRLPASQEVSTCGLDTTWSMNMSDEQLPKPWEAIDGMLIPVEVFGKYGETKALEFVRVDEIGDLATGVRLRIFRTQKGLSRGDLASRLGVPPDAIRKAETEPWDSPVGLIAAICHSLGRSMYELCESIPNRAPRVQQG